MINDEIKRFFRDGRLAVIPKKYEPRQKVLYFFYSLFSEREYTEKEVNETIKEYYDDFSTIRRYLVDYKFLERDKSGKVYRKSILKNIV